MATRKSNLYEYLINRKFPLLRTIRASSVSFSGGGVSYETRQKTEEAAKAYEEELRAKSVSELQELVKQEQKGEANQRKVKAEHDEQERFFNKPRARADYEHWCKAAYWKLDEAIALSFGKAPEVVNWNSVQPYVKVSPFAKKYGRLRDLATRAAAVKQLTDPSSPGFFLAWAKRIGVEYPPELEAELTARGREIADWRTHYEKLQELLTATQTLSEARKDSAEKQIARLTQERDEVMKMANQLLDDLETWNQVDRPLHTKERESLLKIAIGMAIGGYAYDPQASRNTATTDIVNDLAKLGIPLDADTVRKWLREGSEFLPRERND